MAEDPLTSDPGSLFHRLQERYGLGQDPLAMDSPFFAGGQRQYALETVRHLAAFGDMALLVTGARGAGKTRLLAELVKAESERLKFHRFSVGDVATEQSLADALLRIAHHGLGAGRSSRDAIFGFFKWSETATRKGQRIVLLLDDADHMPASVVRVILAAHRAADCGQCAVPVLTGSDSLISSLGIAEAGDGVQQRVHQVHLRPLDSDELAEFLAPRVEKAGGDRAVLLSHSRLKQLHELSQGSFARLKRTAPAVWLDLAGHQPSAAEETGRGSRKILWPALAVVLLGLSWLIVSWQYDEMVASEQEVAARPEPERKTVRLGPDAEIWADIPKIDEPGDQRSAKETATSAENELAVGDDSQAQERMFPKVGPAEQPAERVVQSELSPESAEASVGQPTTTISNDPDENPLGAPESEPGASELAESELDAGGDEGAATQQPEPEIEVELPSSEGASQPENSPAFNVGNPDRFRPVDKLRQREGYTAQYMAGYEESTALEFLQRYPGVDELFYTRSTRKGKPWYVVIYGGFASREEADEAIQQLPQKLAQRDVWIRSFSGL